MAVGTGDLAKAFAKLYLNSCKKEGSLYEVVAVEPLDIDVGERLIDCVPVVDDKLAAYQSADLLLLAIPARALRSFLQNTFDKFGADEILLDCTNPCGHHDLKWALEDLAIGSDRWIKGLNDNGAVALLQRNRTTSSSCTPRYTVQTTKLSLSLKRRLPTCSALVRLRLSVKLSFIELGNSKLLLPCSYRPQNRSDRPI